MAWSDLLAGLAFYLIIEGLFPFASPQAWRRGLGAIGSLGDNQLRSFGLAAVIAGLIMLVIIRG